MLLRTDSSNNTILPYLYRGIVLENEDPMKLGRCKIRIPSIHGNASITADMLPWARPIVTSAIGSNRGSVCIPLIGDIVWVFLEGGEKESPVYIGGTYGLNDLDIDINKIIFYQDDNIKILYDRDAEEFFLEFGTTKVRVEKSGPVEVYSEKSIDIHSKESVNIYSEKSLNISAKESLEVSSGDITKLSSDKSLEISAPDVTLKGSRLNLIFDNIGGPLCLL